LQLPDDEDWLLAPTHAASPPGQKYEVAAERCGCLGNCFVNVYIVTRDHRKTTLCTVQIYTSISLGLPQWLQKSPQKVMKALLWTGTEEVHNGKCIVAWNQIQRLPASRRSENPRPQADGYGVVPSMVVVLANGP
jgi:hypothetical protein